MIRQPHVSVIIVNWNGRHWLEKSLPALDRQTYRNFDTVVVDNNSDDGSVAWIKAQWPRVRILPQTHNTGFALANNIGIQATDSPLIVTLNNDTLPEPEWLQAMVTAVDQPQTGMVAACLLQWDNPEQLDSAGIEVDHAGVAWQRGWQQLASKAAAPANVFGPSAAAALYHRDMLTEIGLFDEDFFAYYEDVDLAWRGQLAGWHCRYAPAARVRHYHSATAGAMLDRKLYLLSRNKIWTLLKNIPSSFLARRLPPVLVYDLLAILFQLGRTRRLTALHGRIDAWRQREIALRKRPSSVPAIPMAPLTPPWRLAAKIRPLR